MDEFKAKAENWYEADGRLFREALAPLHVKTIMAAAATVLLRSAALPAALATAACPGQRAGVVSLRSGNSATASSMMSRSTMLGAQRAASICRFRARSAPERPVQRVWLAQTLEDCCSWCLV